MKTTNEFEDPIVQKVMSLRIQAGRDPEKAAGGRAAFFQEAQKYRSAVTGEAPNRLNGWMKEIQNTFLVWKKEKNPMLQALTALMIMFALILGGGGATVAAAQSSQPDQPLYSVKVWSEDVRLDLTDNPDIELDLLSSFANRRAEEIGAMLQAGKTPDQALQSRYQNQLQTMLQLAAGLPDEKTGEALQMIRQQLQHQNQVMSANGAVSGDVVMEQVRQMLQQRLDWVDAGLEDPDMLRDQLRLQDQIHQQDQIQQEDQTRDQLRTDQPADKPLEPGAGPQDGTVEPSGGSGAQATVTPLGAGNGGPQNGQPTLAPYQNGPNNGQPGGNGEGESGGKK